jgi:hypothetical protein
MVFYSNTQAVSFKNLNGIVKTYVMGLRVVFSVDLNRDL